MKFYNLICTFFLFTSLKLFSAHLICHFDIDRTIAAVDPGRNIPKEKILNLAVAKNFHEKWDDSLKEPVNYYDYVYKHLLPGERGDAILRARRRSRINSFMRTMKKHPNYALYKESYDKALTQLETHAQYLLPSFIEVLKYLESSEHTYTIVLRTFGKNLKTAVSEITLQGINNPKFAYYVGSKLKSGNTVYTTPQEQYDFFCSAKFIAVQDSFPYWQKTKEMPPGGKMIPLDPNSKEVFVLFFDDNIEPAQSKTNVGYGIDLHGKELDSGELLKKHQFIPVNTLQAIINQNYFIKHIQTALEINTHGKS